MKRLIDFSFILCIILFLVFFLLPNYLEVIKIREERRRIEDLNANLKREIENLRDAKERLNKNDPSILEQFARENMGLLKENEIVVDIQD